MAANETVTTTPQTEMAPGVTTLPAPATPPQVFAEPDSPWVARLDAWLVLLVLAFAFLCASFAASNSDFFSQVAAGRLLAEGKYEFGVDPFACTTKGVYWVNHSWLFGLVAHSVYDSFPGHGVSDECTGGVILVVAKAVLVALLAVLMILTGRQRGQSVWLPAACAGLAILALSPRAVLHSTTLSYVFLGLTLFLLRRPRWTAATLPAAPVKGDKDKASPTITVGYPFKALWFIPPLCLLWVNTDTWFFLGPLTVALYLAGELIAQAQSQPADSEDRPAPGELKTLGWVLAASVLVCFINPHHYHAFMIPDQLGLSDAADKLLEAEQKREDYLFHIPFMSPLEELYYSETHLGFNAAGFAYYPLLVLGLISFGVNFGIATWSNPARSPGALSSRLKIRSPSPWRILVWLPFALFSMIYVRGIPFFAVVAGPIMALNFLELAAFLRTLPFTNSPGWGAWRVVGRFLCVLAGIALVVFTIPGWVQAQPFERRRVAFHVHVEPTWVALESRLRAWRQIWRDQGLEDDDAGWYNTTPEVVNFMAYYGDGRRGFLDARLHLFDAAATDFTAVRKTFNLNEEESSKLRDIDLNWRQIFTKRHVRYVLLYTEPGNPPRSLLLKTIPRMLSNPEEWTPLYADGDIFVFGWHDPKEEPPPQWDGLRLNFDREAFGPGAVELRRDTVPDQPHDRDWYDTWFEPEKPRSSAVNLGWFHSAYERTRSGRWEAQESRRWYMSMPAAEMAAGLPVLHAMGNPKSPIVQAHFTSLERPSPAPTYLTIRQLQQSLADNPDDARAYAVLGNAYYDLLWNGQERERSFKNGFPHLALIRHVQIVTALETALKIDPNLDVAHGLLADHYARCKADQVPNFFENRVGFFYGDMELKHRLEQQRLANEAGKGSKEQDDVVTRLKKDVDRQKVLYELAQANKPLIQRTTEALKHGLGETAQDVLEKAEKKELAPENEFPMGVVLRLKLLLSLGRAAEARDALIDIRKEFKDKNKELNWGIMPDLGIPTADWLEILAALGVGDYAEASKKLETWATADHAANEMRETVLVTAYAKLLLEVDDTPLGVLRWNVLHNPNDKDKKLVFVDPNTMRLSKGELAANARDLAFQALDEDCNLKTLCGWLALESGNIPFASRQFREVVAMSQIGEGGLAAGAVLGPILLPADSMNRLHQSYTLKFHALPIAFMGQRWIENAAK